MQNAVDFTTPANEKGHVCNRFEFSDQKDHGGFHLVAKIIRELKSHMIPYKFKCSHWLKLQHSDWRANLVKDFFTN